MKVMVLSNEFPPLYSQCDSKLRRALLEQWRIRRARVFTIAGRFFQRVCLFTADRRLDGLRYGNDDQVHADTRLSTTRIGPVRTDVVQYVFDR